MRYFLSHLPALVGIIALSTSALAFQSIDNKRVSCDPNDTDCFENQNKNFETSISDFLSIAELVLKEQDNENLIAAMKDMTDEEMNELADNLREMELIEIEDILEDAAQNNELHFTHGGFEDCKFCLFSSMCASEKCTFLKCSKPNGKLPNDCKCFFGSRCYYGACKASEDSPGKTCTSKECGISNNLYDTCPDYLECSTTITNGICIEPGQDTEKDNGESCMTDGECKSGRCTTGYVCDDKLDVGEGCGEDEDCKSNNCETNFSCQWNNVSAGCCAEAETNPPVPALAPASAPAPAPAPVLKENGESCSWDDECESGRCTTSWECADKLGDGETCLQNEDCLSNVCEPQWRCWPQFSCCTGNDALVIEI